MGITYKDKMLRTELLDQLGQKSNAQHHQYHTLRDAEA